MQKFWCTAHGAAQPGAALSVDARPGIAFWISELLLLPDTLLDLGGLGLALWKAAGKGSWLLPLSMKITCVCLHLHLGHPTDTGGCGTGFLGAKMHTHLNLVGNQLSNRNWQFLLFSANHSS